MDNGARSSELSLFATTLAEQHEKNEAALAAIHARKGDIEELEKFARALAARGLRIYPQVNAYTAGPVASLRLQVCVTATMSELGQMLEWMAGADIAATRRDDHDTGSIRAYVLKLRALDVHMAAQITTAPASAALYAGRPT